MGIVSKLLGQSRKPDGPLTWGPWKLPFSDRQNNFAFIGTTGSGKTLGFVTQYANILPRITPQSTQRAIIYDKKGDMLPILADLKARGLLHRDVKIIPFNPEDSRTYSWDLASDFATYPSNQRFPAIGRFTDNLFQRADDSERDSAFFRKYVKGAAAAVLEAMIRSGQKWALSDLFKLLGNKEARTRILETSHRGEHVGLVEGSKETKGNIDVSLAVDITPYGEVAELMQLASDSGRTFSINSWLSEPSILVISGTSSPAEPLAYLNRTFLAELIQTLSKKRDTKTDMTWFFLDEAPSIGGVEEFKTLLRECRSKGASTFLGIQDISGFQAVYDKTDVAQSLLAQVTNLAFFLTPDYATAEWGSQRCGTHAFLSNPESEVPTLRPRYVPDDFQNLPQFRPRRGLTGIFLTRAYKPKRATIRPLLLDAENDTPLGQSRWPGDAEPSENWGLIKALGGEKTTERQVGSDKDSGLPTTGRIELSD